MIDAAQSLLDARHFQSVRESVPCARPMRTNYGVGRDDLADRDEGI
jgi:hypothetical protein